MNLPVGVILVVDDDDHVLKALGRIDLGAHFELRLCTTTHEAKASLTKGDVEVALVDQHLGPGEPRGLEFLAELREADPDCFRIIFTGAADLQFAVGAINHGLIDAFLMKPWSTEHLVSLLNQGCETALLRKHNRQLARELSQRNAALEYLNQQLEKMVEERTANLRETLEQLKQKQRELVRMETQANVSQLARGLTHELNNPLAAIMGYSQRLQRTLAGDKDSSQRLGVILREVERCRGLVEQLRGLAAPLDEEAVPCQVDGALQHALMRLAGVYSDVPECQIVGELPVVLAAPRSLARVIEQVLDNARLAGAHACCLSGRKDVAGRVRLSIDNDGATPDETTVRNAVKPFFTTRPEQGHRGLGLSVASSLLREQGGTIELDIREDGKPGAAVIITLPAPEATPLHVQHLRAEPIAGSVMIVDDDAMITELLSDCLGDVGVNAVVVSSAADAYLAINQHAIRAVMADLNLGGGSGIDLLHGLIAIRPGLAHHVALVTGDSDQATLARLHKSTTFPVLGKPFRLEQVQRLVKDIL